jgi:AN1-type zinc finger protein 2
LNHGCELSFKKDFQVPVCPLCSQVVVCKRDQLPDIAMSAHIDRDCKSDPAEERRRKIFNHKCNMKNCKQKEV